MATRVQCPSLEVTVDDERDHEDGKTRALREDSKNLLASGLTLGAFSVVTTALLGTTCPMCIVVAPVMLGAGAFQRWRLACRVRDRARAADEPEGT